MFFVFSQFRANGKKFLLAGLVLVFLAAFLGGCSTDLKPEDDTNYYGRLPDDMVGKWVSDAQDYFNITGVSANNDTVTYFMPGYSYDDGEGGQVDVPDFQTTGTIMFVSNYDSGSGVIIVKYTDPSYYTGKSNPFHAYYYINYIPGTSAEFFDTWDATRADYDADTVTLSEAVKKFTQGKRGNYCDISFHPVYLKEQK
ncbi:MAG: hypothetical protein FWF22_02170 [Treponema sp.]|nr:hypothetical protein [Treponema sp.]